MASFAYTSFEDDVHRGNIDCDTDTFYVLLTTSTYTENQGTHTKRSDVTNEVTGTGYTAGGAAVTVTVTKDTGLQRITLSLGGASWPSSTITARKAVYYKRRGGAATADELVAVNDFTSDVISTAGTFTLNASTIVIPSPA
jgi:hypothetical protein